MIIEVDFGFGDNYYNISVNVTKFVVNQPEPWNDSSDWDNKGSVELCYDIIQLEEVDDNGEHQIVLFPEDHLSSDELEVLEGLLIKRLGEEYDQI